MVRTSHKTTSALVTRSWDIILVLHFRTLNSLDKNSCAHSFCLNFHLVYVNTILYIPEKKSRKIEIHPSYQNLVVTSDLVSQPRTLSLALGILFLRLHARVLALTLAFLHSLTCYLAHLCTPFIHHYRTLHTL